jgi:hypothetical protein
LGPLETQHKVLKPSVKHPSRCRKRADIEKGKGEKVARKEAHEAMEEVGKEPQAEEGVRALPLLFPPSTRELGLSW